MFSICICLRLIFASRMYVTYARCSHLPQKEKKRDAYAYGAQDAAEDALFSN